MLALVENQIDDAKKLLDKLKAEGVRVTAACWIKTDEEQWYLYIASPIVDEQGPAAAYDRVGAIHRQMPQSFWIDPFEIRLIGATHPIAKAVLDLYKKHPAPIPTRYGHPRLGDLSIEAAYIYPAQ